MPEIYAIIETGGKQYKVESGQTIDVDLMDLSEGNTVELDKVLLIADGKNVTIGTPTIEGARVLATSKGDGRSGKTIVMKYKSKIRYHKKTGHRQGFTRLSIDQILAADSKPARRTRRKKTEATEEVTEIGS